MARQASFTAYEVRPVEELPPAELSRAIRETTIAFAGDPTFDFIFRSPEEFAQLVDVNFRYYIKQGKVFGRSMKKE